MRGGFFMFYAVFFIVSVGIVCTFYLRNAYSITHTQSIIHAKIQLELYAQSLKSIALLCLKQKNFATCQSQSFTFPPNYHFQSHLTQLDSYIILLDIHGFIQHPASTNTFRTHKRLILTTLQTP